MVNQYSRVLKLKNLSKYTEIAGNERMPRRISVKRHRKAFKQTDSLKDKMVPKMKPYPIPELEGKAAQVFEQQIKDPPTAIQKRMIEEGTVVFNQTKRRK